MKDERSNPEATCSRLPFGVHSTLPQYGGSGKSPQSVIRQSLSAHYTPFGTICTCVFPAYPCRNPVFQGLVETINRL